MALINRDLPPYSSHPKHLKPSHGSTTHDGLRSGWNGQWMKYRPERTTKSTDSAPSSRSRSYVVNVLAMLTPSRPEIGPLCLFNEHRSARPAGVIDHYVPELQIEEHLLN